MGVSRGRVIRQSERAERRTLEANVDPAELESEHARAAKKAAE